MKHPRTIVRLETKTFFNFGSALLVFLLLLVALEGRLHAANVKPTASRLSATPVELADRMKIHAAVNVRIDGRNVRMVSAELLTGDAYVVSIDESRTEDKADAVITHEPGHAWIYSRHPFLQIEEQANEVAPRLAGRETLKRLYRNMSTQATFLVNIDKTLPLVCKPSNE